MLFISQCLSGIHFIPATILSYIFIPYFIFAFALGVEPLIKRSSYFSKIEFSYGIFLYGFLIQQVVISVAMILHINLSIHVFLLISVIITILPAYLSMRLVEKPMQKLCNKLLCHKRH